MKFLAVILLLSCVEWSFGNQCNSEGAELKVPELKDWQDMQPSCYRSIRDHIQKELKAALTYLSMGAYFTTDKHYRPGTAAFFLESANEEREHAKALIEYLLVRGKTMKNGIFPEPLKKAFDPFQITNSTWGSIKNALVEAMNVEKGVRDDFKTIIKECESPTSKDSDKNVNDYYTVDLMTGTFLQEQHDSIRKIAGHLSTLQKMENKYKNFAEIMFDKTLIQE